MTVRPADRPERGRRRRRAQPSLPLPGGHRARPWRGEDAPSLVAALRDPLVRHYAGLLLDDTAGARLAVLEWNAGWPEGTDAAWALTTADDHVIGSVRFGLTDVECGVGAVGYWLVAGARGRGLATAAVRAATPLVFTGLGWERVELRHAVENSRSCAVARRCGYPAEGTLRSVMRYPTDGRRGDEHLHARLASDPEPPR